MSKSFFKYELSKEVVEFLLWALNRTQVVGAQGSTNLITVINLLKNPINAEELKAEEAKEEKAEKEKKKEEPKK